MHQENVLSPCNGRLAAVLSPPPRQALGMYITSLELASSPTMEVTDLTQLSPGHAHDIKHLTR